MSEEATEVTVSRVEEFHEGDTPVSRIVPRTPVRRTTGNPVWKKGQSGNPAGKKPGTKNKLTIYREAVLMKQEKKMLQEFPEIIGVLMQKAKDGDMTAMKLYLERVMAAKRVAEENEEKGSQQINIVIQGAKASTVMGRVVKKEFDQIPDYSEDEEDAIFEEMNEQDEDDGSVQ